MKDKGSSVYLSGAEIRLIESALTRLELPKTEKGDHLLKKLAKARS